MADPIKIDYVKDWAARLRSRLYTQFRNKVTWEQWIVHVLAPQFQDLEDSAQTLNTLLDIDNSYGVQLDIIGVIVGQKRLSTDDATYRVHIKARIQANRSTGTPEDLYKVFRALLGDTIGLVITTRASDVKAFTLRVRGDITSAQVTVALLFLGIAKEASVRGLLEWIEVPEAQVFRYDTGPGYDQGRYAGALEA